MHTALLKSRAHIATRQILDIVWVPPLRALVSNREMKFKYCNGPAWSKLEAMPGKLWMIRYSRYRVVRVRCNQPLLSTSDEWLGPAIVGGMSCLYVHHISRANVDDMRKACPAGIGSRSSYTSVVIRTARRDTQR